MPETDDTDDRPLLLSPEAQLELERALQVEAAEREALAQSSENLVRARSSESQGQESAANAAHISDDSKARLRFSKSVGIQDLGPTKRAGVRCLGCDQIITKGEYRFLVSAHVWKPPRSMHVGCLQGMSNEQVTNSIRTLTAMLSDAERQQAERALCEEALQLLRCMERQ